MGMKRVYACMAGHSGVITAAKGWCGSGNADNVYAAGRQFQCSKWGGTAKRMELRIKAPIVTTKQCRLLYACAAPELSPGIIF